MVQFLTREEQRVETQAFTVLEPDPSMLHNGYTWCFSAAWYTVRAPSHVKNLKSKHPFFWLCQMFSVRALLCSCLQQRSRWTPAHWPGNNTIITRLDTCTYQQATADGSEMVHFTHHCYSH